MDLSTGQLKELRFFPVYLYLKSLVPTYQAGPLRRQHLRIRAHNFPSKIKLLLYGRKHDLHQNSTPKDA